MSEQPILNLPGTLDEDLRTFKEKVARFKDGSLPGPEFRAFRVPQGVYEERTEGSFMLRVRLPAGAGLPHQLRALASAAREHGKDALHVTTRQDIQIHSVDIDGIHPALMELYEAGLSTKGGGGNTVRNITACSHAGVCAKEAFDVTPHVVALSEFLLPDPLSFQLPRKYKIALSGCPVDCAGAMVNDLGLIAKERDGKAGFAVYVAGGMGGHPRVADPLEEFVLTGEICYIAEAVKRVFDKHGNRKNRHRARLRFLVGDIGIDRFRELYEAELAEIKSQAPPVPEAREVPQADRSGAGAGVEPADGFDSWRERNVEAQRQDGFFVVHVPLVLGDITTGALSGLADVVAEHGEGMVRATQSQNLVIRWTGEGELTAVHAKLATLGLADSPPAVLRNAVACTGASTCKLGICLPRGLARAVTDKLMASGLDLEKLGDLSILMSGCPNSCGRHPIGSIGLFGAARRIEGRLVPHYVVQLGGRTGEGVARLAEGNSGVPALKVPEVVAGLLKAFVESPQCPDFGAFVDADGRGIAERLVEIYRDVPSFEEDKNFYFDWGAETPFSLAGRGPGECGAGVFELIEVDLASARAAFDEGRLQAAAGLSARALLVTQGLEASDDAEALSLFAEHFIDKGLVAESLRGAVEAALEVASGAAPPGSFDDDGEAIGALVNAVKELYDGMDSSLRFSTAKPDEPAAETTSAPAGDEAGSGDAEPAIDREEDLHGVSCPLNYVKTKLFLEGMSAGQVLAVILNDEGARNVPQSAEGDGHEVVSVKQQDGRWRVVLRKGQ